MSWELLIFGVVQKVKKPMNGNGIKYSYFRYKCTLLQKGHFTF